MKSILKRKKNLQGQLHIGYPGDEWVERKGEKRFNLIDFCVEIMRGHIRQTLTGVECLKIGWKIYQTSFRILNYLAMTLSCSLPILYLFTGELSSYQTASENKFIIYSR